MSGLDEKDVADALAAFNCGLVREASDKNPRGFIDFYRPMVAMEAAISAYLSAVGQKAGTVEVKALIQWAHDTLYEINPSNYDHDEVCKLNDASVEVILVLARFLGEKHGHTEAWWAEWDATRSALIPAPSVAEAAEPVGVLTGVDLDTVTAVMARDLFEFATGRKPNNNAQTLAKIQVYLNSCVRRGGLSEFVDAPSPVVPSGLEALVSAQTEEVMKLARETATSIAAGVIGNSDAQHVERHGAKLIARALTADRASCQARIEELERAACLVCSFTWTSKDANAIAAMQALSSVALPARSALEGK